MASPQEFYSRFAPYAQQVSKRTGLDPRLVLAQAALETGYGKSAPNNNFFGIKSHGKSGGANLQTKEFEGGQMVTKNQNFRGYSDPGQSFNDYADFILQNPRYRPVMEAGGLEGQIAAMGRSGYATDPNYASKLASIANRFDPSAPVNIASDTMSALGMQPQAQEQQPMGLLSTASTQGTAPQEKEKWWNPDRRDRLVMGLEGMTLNPNPGIMYAARQGLEERSQGRKEAKLEQKAAERRTRTAEWLAQQGRTDLAEAVGRGMIDPKAAVGEAMKPGPEKYETISGERAASMGLDPAKAYKLNTATNEISGIGAANTTVNVGGEKQTAGWKKIDETFATEQYVPWVSGGGADTMKQIGQLNTVVDKLLSGEQITGPAIGLQPDALQSIFNPEALDAKQRVQEVVQRNLRVILGSQFTEKEGEGLINRAFDQRLKPEQNAARLSALVKQMESAAQAKNAMVKYFNENGTLQGFESAGYIPTKDDFTALFDQLDERQGLAGEQSGTDSPPKRGEVVDGYKFMGGDPANPNSWRKVQ